jgi:recombination protein RecA
VFSTGALTLDLALGVGGIPQGRITEIIGWESSGKTTLALTVVANAQKEGKACVYIDTEHAVDLGYAKKLGVDIDSLYFSQPDSGEQALEICEAFVKSGLVSVIIVDSVTALVPKKEIEGDYGDAQMGAQARLMSQALRKLTSLVDVNDVALVFCNQYRNKIGGYGNPDVATGGHGLKFFTSVRIEVRKSDAIKDGEEVIANKITAKVIKNKVASPFKKAEYEIRFGEGIDKSACLVDAGLSIGVFSRKGTWYYFGEERLSQGRENLIKILKSNPLEFDKYDKIIREKLKTKIDIVDFGKDNIDESSDSEETPEAI